MTLYTAIGKYEFRRNTAGEKLPHIITSTRDHEPDIWEMLIWSSLLWNILTYEEIYHQFYEKERQPLSHRRTAITAEFIAFCQLVSAFGTVFLRF